ncbi:MAG: hypothetical protein AAB515_01140 [Patescibacteria group bacterium]
MLVQKQTPERLKKILLFGGIPILLLGGYVLYLNMSSSGGASTGSTPTQTKTVAKDFGQAIFRDPRFYALSPKGGTELITQATAEIPATEVAAPTVEAFNVQTGGAILFTWKPPAKLDATLVRVSRAVGDTNENLVTLPATATSYLYTQAVDGQAATYVINYVKQVGAAQSAQIAAKVGASGGGLTIEAADAAGVRLQWVTPGAAEGKKVEVYRSDAAGLLGRRVAALDASTTNFNDAGGKADMHFYTVVWLTDSIGGLTWTGKITSTDATMPDAPDFVTTAYDGQNNLVRVSWVPSPSADVVRYDVFRSDAALLLGTLVGQKNVQDVATLDQAATTTGDCSKELCIENKNLIPGKTLYYTVIAVDRAGNQSSGQELGKAGRANPFVPL